MISPISQSENINQEDLSLQVFRNQASLFNAVARAKQAISVHYAGSVMGSDNKGISLITRTRKMHQ